MSFQDLFDHRILILVQNVPAGYSVEHILRSIDLSLCLLHLYFRTGCNLATLPASHFLLKWFLPGMLVTLYHQTLLKLDLYGFSTYSSSIFWYFVLYWLWWNYSVAFPPTFPSSFLVSFSTCSALCFLTRIQRCSTDTICWWLLYLYL